MPPLDNQTPGGGGKFPRRAALGVLAGAAAAAVVAPSSAAADDPLAARMLAALKRAGDLSPQSRAALVEVFEDVVEGRRVRELGAGAAR